MAQPTDVVDQVAQLDAARNLVLGDAAFYPQIVNGILPIVGAHARLELRRWGADFLAETFATPMLGAAQKEQLAPNVLQAVLETLMLPETDSAVLQSLVQTAASLYPLIFRHMYVHYNPSLIASWRSLVRVCVLTRDGASVNHPEDSKAWETMNAIKQDILRRMDSFPCPVKICCVKFVQRVVQVQTPGLISDPRVCSPSVSFTYTS